MKVIVVLKNADFTEGRGPMLLDNVFTNDAAARDYINSRPSGIFGAQPPEGVSRYDHMKSGKDGGWSGYSIKEMEAYESIDDLLREENESRRKAALAKLSDEDRRALNL